MKRKLIITVICLFIMVFVLICYCYIKQQNEEYERSLRLFPPVEIKWVDPTRVVDSTKIYNINALLEMSNEDLKKVRAFEHYSRDDKGYDTFPPIVSQLINLEYLNFSGDNNISDLTPIKHLVHLQEISLEGNRISDLKGFGNFTNLKYLNIGYNELSDLKGIEKLKNLQYLNLFANRNLSNLKGIETLTNLEFLTIGRNNFDSFPTEILHIKNLKELSLEDLYFKSFPDSFYIVGLSIERLTMENMPNFNYTSNLSKFHKLNNLQKLYLFGDDIPKLNIDFEKCKNLETFSYWDQKNINIVDILNRISKAPKLKYLGLSNNNIKYLPKDIVLPDSLEGLNLTNNNIKRLPAKITKHTNLKIVYLRSNPIDTMLIKKIEKEMVNTKFYYDK